jgi:DNA repair exonuclease SbcCD ATPase subunit
MIRFIELHIRNFLSYGDNLTVIPLEIEEPTLIIGENLDVIIDGEHDNNGAGKTSILNALAFALYGKTVSEFKKLDEIINNINKKNLYVAVIFEVNGTFFKVERWRKNKDLGGSGNNGVRFSSAENVKDLTKPDNIKTPAGRSVDEYIAEDILRMPFDIFVRIVVYSASFEPFLNLPATSTNKTSQTSILEEIFGQKELTEKANNLKPKIKETKASITRLIELNERIEEETSRYAEQLELAKGSVEKWDEDHAAQIKKAKDDIKQLELIDFAGEIKNQKTIGIIRSAVSEKEAEIDKLKFKLAEYKKTETNIKKWESDHKSDIEKSQLLLKQYDDIDFNEQSEQLDKLDVLNEKYDNNVKTINDNKSELSKIYETLEGLNEEVKLLKSALCPYCKQTYHENEDKIKEKEAELNQYALQYTTIENANTELNDDNEKLLKDIDSVDCIFDSRSLYEDSKRAFEAAQADYERLISQENPYTLDATIDLTKHQEEIDVLEEDIRVLNAEADSMERDGVTLDSLYADQSRLDQLKKTLADKTAEPNPHTETVERLEKAFANIDEPRDDEIDELKKLLTHQEFLLKLLTRKDSHIRQELLNINLPLLNTQLRYYLDAIGMLHKVEFTKDMTISISQFNNPISFSNLSGGQKARINIALAFAFRDVVQARHQKINFCILDECLDTGLSNLGIKLASKMIKKIAKDEDLNMYVITHRDEIKSSFNKTLKATLKGGLTTVTMN